QSVLDLGARVQGRAAGDVGCAGHTDDGPTAIATATRAAGAGHGRGRSGGRRGRAAGVAGGDHHAHGVAHFVGGQHVGAAGRSGDVGAVVARGVAVVPLVG